ncbi:MAG: D-alanyl-D-alanine carboxypeptidase [Flavobacteriales bacterium]|nr:D-alanyl-D-alanine carboxypeptidase [Flavobacteriales bacterium]
MNVGGFRKVLAILGFLGIGPIDLVGQYSALIQKLTSDRRLAGASWAISVVRCSDGKTLLSHNADLWLVPASVQKILTTAAALELLGPYHRFTSHFYLKDERAHGNLWQATLLVDPHLNPAFGSALWKETSPDSIFRSLAFHLRKLGLEPLCLRVVPLVATTEAYNLPDFWYLEDVLFKYGTWPTPFVYKENSAVLSLQKVKDRIEVRYNGSSDIPDWIELNVVPKSPSQNIAKARLVVKENEIKWNYQFNIQKIRDSFRLKIPDLEPQKTFFKELRAFLEKEFVSGEDCFEFSYEEDIFQLGRHLLRVEGPTVKELDSVINHESHNFFTEMLLRNLFPQHVSYSAKLEALQTFWQERTGIRPMLSDACGLSRSNLLSCNLITSVLRYMYQSEWFQAFYSSLPIWGVSGTLKDLGGGREKAYHNVRAKSGSMRRIAGYAGYIFHPQEGMLCFALLINNYISDYKEIKELGNEIINHFFSN